MSTNRNHFEFTGVIFREGRNVGALCLELDVASQGRTVKEARKMLAEAVSLYLETCFENGIPHLRPVPRAEDPRVRATDDLIEVFPLKVDFGVRAVA